MAPPPAFWTREAAMRRLTLAVSISALGHAAVLAGAPLSPGFGDFSLLGQGEPLRARLTTSSEPAWEAVPPVNIERVFAGVPPVDIAQASAGNVGLPGLEIFYRGSEVDQRAEATNHPDIEYPEAALSAGLTGVVRLQLKIDRGGALREATVLQSEPAGVFDEVALKAARSLKFKPAIRNGVPVASIKVIEVPFEPNCMRTGSCVQPAAPR